MKTKILTKLYSNGLIAQGVIVEELNKEGSSLQKLRGLFGGDRTPAGSQTLGELAVTFIQVLLLAAASFAVFYLVYGGYQYITSRGSDEQMEQAKKTFQSAILGLLIIVLAFAIVSLIARALIEGGPGGLGV